MKKILCMLLACVFCVSTLGGCQGGKEPLADDDFEYYDENGQVQEFDEEEHVTTMSRGEEIAGKTLQTKRGVKIGDPISVIAEKYDVSVARALYYYEGGEAGELREFSEKYPTGEDAFNHLDEIKDKFDLKEDYTAEEDYIFIDFCLLDNGEYIASMDAGDRPASSLGFKIFLVDGEFVISQIIIYRVNKTK